MWLYAADESDTDACILKYIRCAKIEYIENVLYTEISGHLVVKLNMSVICYMFLNFLIQHILLYFLLFLISFVALV
jgi:hypothetical protein